MIQIKHFPDNIRSYLTNGRIDPFTGIVDPRTLRKMNRKRRLKAGPIKAIYFLFKKKELIYIGKCTSLRDRLQDHERGREHIKQHIRPCGKIDAEKSIAPKDFDQFSFVHLPLNIAEEIEKPLIARYRPSLNKVGVDKGADQISWMDQETVDGQ